MIFYDTKIEGAKLIELEKMADDRGYFARTFCAEQFANHGLETVFVQHNTSASAEVGTLRGLHFQAPPYEEIKVVRAVKGAVWDVILDLRQGSSTYGKWQGFELTEENGMMVYVPKGCGHAMQTLREDSVVTYLSSHPYTPKAERGVRWNDPSFSIDWPIPVTSLSEKDAAWADFHLHAGNQM